MKDSDEGFGLRMQDQGLRMKDSRVLTPGAEVVYAKSGRGPAVLLIQGAGVVGAGWRPQIEELAGEYTLYAFDNRGIGGSRLDAGRVLAIEDMAHDALAIMDAEGVDTFHVAGHSMGGLIAQALALNAADRVKSLALLCTFVKGAQGARMSAAMLLTALRMRIGTRAMRRNAFLELVMPDAYLRSRDRAQLAAEVAPLFGYDLASQPYFVMKQVQAMAAYDASERWPDVRVPTLIVSAALDRIALPEYGRALAELIPGSRFVELAGAGHGVTIQCAPEINALLRDHLSRAEAPAVAATGPPPDPSRTLPSDGRRDRRSSSRT